MLRERGLAPKRKGDRNNPLVRYSAGHRPQDIAEVGRGIARLASLWIILDRVEVRAKGKKAQIYTEEGRLIELNARLTRTSLINGTTVPVAWTMNVGDALAGQVRSLSPLTPIARKVIGYDPTTDGPSGWASTSLCTCGWRGDRWFNVRLAPSSRTSASSGTIANLADPGSRSLRHCIV